MIYLLYGTDTHTSSDKLQKLIAALHAKKPDASVVRVTADDFEPESILEYIGGQGLFENKLMVIFDHISEHIDGVEVLKTYAKEIAESDNIFLIRERKLPAPLQKKLEKYAEKTQAYEAEEVEPKKDNTLFTVADALGSRHMKDLWVSYQKAKVKNYSDEEIHSIMLWSVKSMMLSKDAQYAEEVGLNPFVFRKNKQFSKNYTHEELIALSRILVMLYHDAHRGKHELGNALEKFTLTLRYD